MKSQTTINDQENYQDNVEEFPATKIDVKQNNRNKKASSRA